ncbi:hypothetical protein AMATHDRAFT_10392 [Amanita thiersii Skay4041]|uniref:Uncharacterized protein n=1 Tax=Amanita thiersii Skay4041 TaxID=703135 RepID=A0A2A9N6T1_9AGAR|nr:hypothetical protein AMATHDRAFT_10392 [Amanita thiersii Skay4041]
MHCFPFKKVKKTQPNSGTGFFYVAPGYKLSMEEIHKVQSKNFNTNSYAEELRCKELLTLHKLPPKSDEEVWTTIQCLKCKDHYEDLRTKRRQDYARSHAYQIETLNHNLEYHPDLRRSLLKDPKNHFFTWLRGGVELLQKYGWSISNKERNRFQHSLNGNYIPFEIAERLPLVVLRYLTIYHWSDDIQRVYIACKNLDGFARINFLSIIRHHYFIWILGGEPLLNHYGWELSAEDRNRFMHALNGNIEAIHERILLVREFHEAILYIMESLKDASQPTMDSFFECRENHFLIWIQRLSNAIIEEIKNLSSAKEIWKYLENKYNKAGSAQVFGDIQKVYAFQIRGNQNPEANIAKLALLFARLKSQGAEMSKFYQAMTLLNVGAMKWPHLMSIYLSQNKMKDLDFDKIKVMFVANWHRTATLGQPTPKVNKISGVQQKKKDPKWKKGKGKDDSKSESPTSPSSDKSSSGKKFQGGRRTKKKANSAIEEVNNDEPSHILSFAASAMVPHYVSTESIIDSRPSASPQKYQGTPTKGAWETVPEAISLLHRMGIKPSIQTVKTTEEPLLEATDDAPETIPDPITAPEPEVVVDWDDVVSLGDEPTESYIEAEQAEMSATLTDESMDYFFKEMIQDA